MKTFFERSIFFNLPLNSLQLWLKVLPFYTTFPHPLVHRLTKDHQKRTELRNVLESLINPMKTYTEYVVSSSICPWTPHDFGCER